MKKDAYQCPCCGYKTLQKAHMHKHLYQLKRQCPKTFQNVELTEEVKQCVMVNRVWSAKHEQQHYPAVVNVTQIINNYNTVNNFITNMETLDKLNKYASYKGIEINSFDQTVSKKYAKRIHKLDNDSFKYMFELKIQQFYEIVDEVSSVYNMNGGLEDLNIIHDSKSNKLKLYLSGEWDELIMVSGIKRIISIIQTCYLNTYERYLLRALENPSTIAMQRQQCMDALAEYYKFIGCFDVDPYVKGKSLDEIVGHGCSESDTYYSLYVRTKEKVPKTEATKIKKSVVDIIKRNVAKNVEEVNKHLLDIVTVSKRKALD